jgi:hypothetical protein
MTMMPGCVPWERNNAIVGRNHVDIDVGKRVVEGIRYCCRVEEGIRNSYTEGII